MGCPELVYVRICPSIDPVAIILSVLSKAILMALLLMVVNDELYSKHGVCSACIDNVSIIISSCFVFMLYNMILPVSVAAASIVCVLLISSAHTAPFAVCSVCLLCSVCVSS